MQIQIRARYVETTDNGNVVLSVDLDQNPAINEAIQLHCDNLIRLGVSKRSAYGLCDDMTDGILRDAVATLISPR